MCQLWRLLEIDDVLLEFPLVRYPAAKSLDPTTMTTFRDLIPTKLAANVWNCLMKYKASLPNYPQTETCELLILDRSIDQVLTFCQLLILCSASLYSLWSFYTSGFFILFFCSNECIDCSHYTRMDIWCNVPWCTRHGGQYICPWG